MLQAAVDPFVFVLKQNIEQAHDKYYKPPALLQARLISSSIPIKEDFIYKSPWSTNRYKSYLFFSLYTYLVQSQLFFNCLTNKTTFFVPNTLMHLQQVSYYEGHVYNYRSNGQQFKKRRLKPSQETPSIFPSIHFLSFCCHKYTQPTSIDTTRYTIQSVFQDLNMKQKHTVTNIKTLYMYMTYILFVHWII